MDDVAGLGCCEQGCAGAVAEEAEVAVVCDDVDGRVPGRLGGGIAARTYVVYGADVAAVEAEAGSDLEHAFVAGVSVREGEGLESGRRWVEGEG